MRQFLAGAAALLAMLCGAAAANAVSYDDPVGDSRGAPDITAVSVRNTPKGRLTFSVTTNVTSLVPGHEVWLVLSSDGDPATGDNGYDYYIGLYPVDGGKDIVDWSFGKYVGKTATRLPGRTLGATYSGGVVTFSMDREEIGNPTWLEFYVESHLMSGEQSVDRDHAPDGDATYEYALVLPRTRTFADAPGLRSRVRYDGASMKHVRIGENLYATMKKLGAPRVVTVACWSNRDWPSVLESTELARQADDLIDGFWLSRQPRWLHLAPKQCADIQALLDTRKINGQRAYALATALHERVHAEGVRNEAETNCYSVQLVYDFARELNFVHAEALYLEALAVRKTRATAPPSYWDAARCRDGGKWDLFGKFGNLDY